MSMLAGQKVKQKISSDPRNKAWSNDSSKLGQQLMEKMGWKEGKGLGMHEDGKTNHIRVSLKNNSLGLGCSQKHDDNWIGHQDDFNDLLSSLGQDHSTPDQQVAPAKPQSLQKKSKSSKNRVHYQKFTQGKDLSTYNASAMDCIMGVRSNSNTPRNQSGATSDTDSECVSRAGFGMNSQQEGNTTSQDGSHGVQTTTSSTSMQEYFAQKMKALREKRLAEQTADTIKTQPEDSPVVGDGTTTSEYTTEDTEAKTKKKSKKKRKKVQEVGEAREVSTDEVEEQNNECQVEAASPLQKCDSDVGDGCKKAKKKKIGQEASDICKEDLKQQSHELDEATQESTSKIDDVNIRKKAKKKTKKTKEVASESSGVCQEDTRQLGDRLPDDEVSQQEGSLENNANDITTRKKKRRKDRSKRTLDCVSIEEDSR